MHRSQARRKPRAAPSPTRPHCPAHLSQPCPPAAPCRQAQVRHTASQVYNDSPLFRGLLHFLERPAPPPRLPRRTPRPYEIFAPPRQIPTFSYNIPPVHVPSPPPTAGRSFRICPICARLYHVRRQCMACAPPQARSSPLAGGTRKRRRRPSVASRKRRRAEDVTKMPMIPTSRLGVDSDSHAASSAVSVSASIPDALFSPATELQNELDTTNALNGETEWRFETDFTRGGSSSTCAAALSDVTSESVYDEGVLSGLTMPEGKYGRGDGADEQEERIAPDRIGAVPPGAETPPQSQPQAQANVEFGEGAAHSIEDLLLCDLMVSDEERPSSGGVERPLSDFTMSFLDSFLP